MLTVQDHIYAGEWTGTRKRNFDGVARASRVLATVSRRRELSLCYEVTEKSVSARRRNQTRETRALPGKSRSRATGTAIT